MIQKHNISGFIDKGGRNQLKRVLFPGASCYPISPCQKMMGKYDQDNDIMRISQNDQLVKIFKYSN